MKTRIIATVSNNIATDQRLKKVGSTLQKGGYDFNLIGFEHRGKPKINVPFSTKRLPIWFKKNMFFYAEVNFRLFFYLLSKNKKNTLLLANDLDTLPAVYLVSVLSNTPLVFDSHEIFSQLPSLKKGSFQQRIWEGLEKFLVPKVKYFYTVSDSYADWFKKQYENKATVIKNVPNRKEKMSVDIPSQPNVLIYQGAINPSRGIENMISAMEFLPDFTLWIIGDGPKLNDYKSLAQKLKVDNIQFFGRLSPEELQKLTPQATLGLSLEEDNGLSYRYALPNKLFDYIHASIPILGTDELPEVKSIIEKYNIGLTVKNREPKHIAEKIQELASTPKEQFTKGLKQAKEELNWENQESELLSLFSKAAQDI